MVSASRTSRNLSKKMGTSPWELFSQPNSSHPSSDASLFSSSLPVLAHEKPNLNELNHDLRSVDDISTSSNDFGPDLDGKNHAVGLLPDGEDELLAGIADGFDIGWLPSLIDDSDEYDVFDNGGGLELEYDPQENLRIGASKLSLSDGSSGNGMPHSNLTYGIGTVAGEHPLGEHPSRTLFVRNINSSVEDSELRTLFEQYGDIRTLYTACKHRGFVMISYYDIRAAKTAMRSLQNKPLQRRKLDIHFSIPKENPSEKDINQGTLVVFNLDPSVTNDELRQIFGAYGEVKEIRETPHKIHHKFIEFYDVRAAEAALTCLNRTDIAGKRVKLELSRPGGARRSLLMNPIHELEQDDRNSHQVGSSFGNSPPGNWPRLSSSMDRNSPQNFSKSPVFSSLSPHLERIFSNGSSTQAIFEQSHSLPNHSSFSLFSGPQLFWGSSEHNNSESRTQTMSSPFIPRRNIGFSSPNMGSPVLTMMSSPRQSPMFLDNQHFLGFALSNSKVLAKHGRSRCVESNGIPIDYTKRFRLDLDKIRTGEDTRTTLMIKNIPNKYTSKMLLATIDEHHKGSYDFFYLPIDFKNKCSMGYAFINMLSPLNIIPFSEAFNGKKWEKFNSKKVAFLAYARIQGRTALVSRFQNSSLMNEDKCRRPILFNSSSPESDNKMIEENLPAYKSNGSKLFQDISVDQVEKR